jgi:hypothetical protein
MSQPELLATPDGWQVGRDHSQPMVGPETSATGADGLATDVAGHRDGGTTHAVLAAAGPIDLGGHS